jgi:hypothetical protein
VKGIAAPRRATIPARDQHTSVFHRTEARATPYLALHDLPQYRRALCSLTKLREVLAQRLVRQRELKLRPCRARTLNHAALTQPEASARRPDAIAVVFIPVGLVLAHYEACDKLGLNAKELQMNGAAVGNRLQQTTLVSAAKKARGDAFDLWSAVGQLHRMWPRL